MKAILDAGLLGVVNPFRILLEHSPGFESTEWEPVPQASGLGTLFLVGSSCFIAFSSALYSTLIS